VGNKEKEAEMDQMIAKESEKE